jgi:hypothetical protein
VKLTLPEWRRLKNIPVEKIADYCDVHPNTYRGWEEKPSSIKLVNAVKVCECIDVSMDDVIFLP